MSWQLIETNEALVELLENYQDRDVVMVDTEFMREKTFFPQIALVQLCYGDEKAWLIDPVAVSELSPLSAMLENPSVTKVLHSPSEDLEVFQKALGVLPVPLFDTQRAAALLNRGFGLGYRALVESICGIELAKGETRSNWLRRPLTESQLHYAALDVIPLWDVYQNLNKELLAADRLPWVLEDGAVAVRSLQEASPEPWMRIKSAWKLRPEQLGVLAVVCQWREMRARDIDKPRSWILSDKSCFSIASTLPGSEAALGKVEELSPSVARKQGELLLKLVEAGLALAPGKRPTSPPKPLGRAEQDKLKSLKRKGRELAEALDIAPEILLAAKDYELMLRLGQGEQLEQPVRWKGWRLEPVVTPLLREAGVNC